MKKTAKSKRQTEGQKQGVIDNILADFITDDSVDELFEYLEHIKVDACALPKGASPRLLLEHVYDHYRVAGKIDIDQACQDLAEYPPIAAHIAALQAGKKAETTARAG